MEMAYYPSHDFYEPRRRPSFPDIDFQIALVPSEHIKPEKAIGLTRESYVLVLSHITENFSWLCFRNN